MTLAARWQYYRRIVPAYLGAGDSQLTFWHETPELNPHASSARLGPYYMRFRQKADYTGPCDAAGIPLLHYRGAIGLQYNPIAIAQWGLANCNLFYRTLEKSRQEKFLKAADWLVANLRQNSYGLWVWNHNFDWEYRTTLRTPWYSGLAQGQGVSLLLRAYAETHNEKYAEAANLGFVSLTKPIAEGGVLIEDQERNLWIEEYIVDPPTHILNGFIWALWGVFDYWLTTDGGANSPAREYPTSIAREVFDRGVRTLLRNLDRYDTGYWSLYEQSGTRLKMLASPFYHRLHIVQLRVMALLTGDAFFTNFAEKWQRYANRPANRARALVEKSTFKLLHY
ncbi:MAG: D-glucuronyl C5-epimerase family protein [Terriglobales bacterium]